MINPVGLSPVAGNVNTNLLNQVKTDKKPVENNKAEAPKANGADVLAVYNQAAIKKPEKADKKDLETLKNLQPSIPTVLQPEAIKVLKGDRIKTAHGNLYAIVDKTPETTTTYIMDVQAPEAAIRKIITTDNKTGKKIRVQENFNEIKEGVLPSTFLTEIYEFYPNSDDVKKLTTYYQGKPEVIEETVHNEDGSKKHYINDRNTLMICEEKPKDGVTKITKYDNDGNITSVETEKKAEYYSETVRYDKGIPTETVKEVKKPTENKTGKDPFNDENLKPAEKYDINGDPKTFEGEKETYSNGALQSIKVKNDKGGEITYLFDLNGDLESIDDNLDADHKKAILYHKPECSDKNGHYTIKEDLGNGIEKDTTYVDNGTVEVRVVDNKNDSEKYAQYSKDGYMEMYIENGSKDNAVRMLFDKDGNLLE